VEKTKPLTLAERTRRFRERARLREGIAAVAVARIVAGRPPGDSGRSLAQWLKAVADKLPEDDERRSEIEEAAATLERRKR
jgi:hypothetical protein